MYARETSRVIPYEPRDRIRVGMPDIVRFEIRRERSNGFDRRGFIGDYTRSARLYLRVGVRYTSIRHLESVVVALKWTPVDRQREFLS